MPVWISNLVVSGPSSSADFADLVAQVDELDEELDELDDDKQDTVLTQEDW